MTTDKGEFSCDKNSSSVLFKLGYMELGRVSDFEKNIYPQDLVGVSKEDFTDERLVLMARLLQSLDDDGNITKNINITKEVKAIFKISQFSDMTVTEAEQILARINKKMVSEKDAIEHLKNSLNKYNK